MFVCGEGGTEKEQLFQGKNLNKNRRWSLE